MASMTARATSEPVAAKAASTRAALVDAAEELLRELPYSEVTLRAVARRAGFTTGAVFSHFRGKADLVVEVAERQREVSLRFVVDVVDAVWAAHDDEAAAELLIGLLGPESKWLAGFQFDLYAEATRDPQVAARLGVMLAETVELFAGLRVFAEIPDGQRRQAAMAVLTLWQGVVAGSVLQPPHEVAGVFATGARALLSAYGR